MSLWTDRLRRLDDRVLGRPVPDDRPVHERLLRPRPAVWTLRGRVAYGLTLAVVFAALWWLPQTVAIFVMIGVLPVAFLLVAADERKRSAQDHHRT